MTSARTRIPTVIVIAIARAALGKDELRRRAQAIHQEQLHLGWGGGFPNGHQPGTCRP